MPSKFYTGIDLRSSRAINAADPTAATDLTTKLYVDNLVSGLAYKNEVRAATTTNGTLASAYANGQTIDGVVLATNDRILLKDQTTQSDNGIYTVNASGAPTRATDADSTAELNNATVYVTSGTVNGGREYTQTTANPTVGSSNIVWVQKTTGVAYTADGNGLELSGQQFALELDGTTLSKSSAGLRVATGYATALAGAGLTESAGVLAVGAGTGISVAADAVSADFGVVVRKYAANCVVTTNPQTFTHNLGTDDITVTIWEVATNEKVFPQVTKGSGTVIVDWGSAPTAGQYRVVAHG